MNSIPVPVSFGSRDCFEDHRARQSAACGSLPIVGVWIPFSVSSEFGTLFVGQMVVQDHKIRQSCRGGNSVVSSWDADTGLEDISCCEE